MLNTALQASESHLYQALASELAGAIAQGTLKVGDRLPSTRKLAARYNVSMATAVQAFRELENRHLIEARARSGYFVARTRTVAVEPAASRPPASVRYAVTPSLLQEFITALDTPGVVRLGSAVPSSDWLPTRQLARLSSSIIRRRPSLTVMYQAGRGALELREAIARRALEIGCRLHADDIVITNGCVEALNLCLRSVARPGDTVAVESPTYHLLLHALASLGLKVLEIPTHPATGASVEAIDLATSRRGAIKALLLIPTHQNPVGSVMPDEHKARLVELCEQRGVALIEDDIYGDASFGQVRPLPAKAWDKRGNVLYCSSFTKTLAPGMRVGWCAPGRHVDAVALTKRATSIFTAHEPQLAIAEFLSTGGYDRHLKRLRASLRDNAERVLQRVQETFPAGCRVTNPGGGYVLWVELPRRIDAVELFHRARAQNIVIAPGPLFSMSSRYDNFVRISFGEPWSPALDRAIATVGQLAGGLLMSGASGRGRSRR